MEQYEWLSIDSFEWELYGEYDIEPRGGAIAASGSKRQTYRPHEDAPMAHRKFIALDSSRSEADMLQFVREHGFLGLDGDREKPTRETLAELWRACSLMALYAAFAHDDPKMKPSDRDRLFNLNAPQHMDLFVKQEHGKAVLRMQPRSLLAWMWVRLAQEKTGFIELKKCALPSCGNEFFVSADLRMKRKEYCGPKCRARHWYQLKPKATKQDKGGTK